MKKSLVLIVLGMFLASCTSGIASPQTGSADTQSAVTAGTGVTDSGGQNASALRELVASLAPHMKKTKNDVTAIQTSYMAYPSIEAMPAYVIQHEAMSAKEAFAIDTQAMFDGWTIVSEMDPTVGFYAEYTKSDFICSLAGSADSSAENAAQITDFLNAENEEVRGSKHQKIKFIVTLACSEKPNHIDYLEAGAPGGAG